MIKKCQEPFLRTSHLDFHLTTLKKVINYTVDMIKKKKIAYISEEEEMPTDKLKKFKKKLKECQKEKEEYLTQAQRARADLINYRRRQELVLEELRKYGQSNLILEILSVLDSLRIGSEKDKGLEIIKEQLECVLKKYGLREIKSVGEIFNPEIHDAIEEVESDNEKGVIIEEIQKGYMIGEKLLRPSKVKVAK
ncbi:nucleotide exchange factor GrpE [Patescibacteria group bacterium]|nr:nucleotide exchange factor GrpE [Patescibacteria group bacterium]